MAQDSSISIFVPLLVLIIVEISQVAREFDLVAIAEKKQEPFFYSVFYLLDQSSQDIIKIPQLGPFNFIHGMNLAILYLGFTLIVTSSGGSRQVIIALIVWLFWVLVPVLEVKEYVIIMDDPNVGPISFLYHSIVTTIAAIGIFMFGDAVITSSQGWVLQQPLVLYILGVVVLFYADLIGFLTLLEGELERAERQST